jgi:hypothetical protein
MSTYICEKCGCVDNTACGGNYAAVVCNLNLFTDEYSNTHQLCSMCTPNIYSDGTCNPSGGKWQKHFAKKHWSEYGSEEKLLEARSKSIGNYCNAKKYFENLHKQPISNN